MDYQVNTVSSVVCSWEFLVTRLGSIISEMKYLIVDYQVSAVSGIVCSCEFCVTGLESIIIIKMKYFLYWVIR